MNTDVESNIYTVNFQYKKIWNPLNFYSNKINYVNIWDSKNLNWQKDTRLILNRDKILSRIRVYL